MLVMRDIMCSGYVAGGNTKFFGEDAAKNNGGVYTNTIVQGAITDRLAFTDDASGEYDSMLAFPSTPALAAKRDQVISITSRLLPWEVTMDPTKQYDYFPGGAAVKDEYEKYYGLGTIHFGEDIRAAEAQEFIAQGSLNNSTCFIGPHRVHSPWSNTFFDLCPGQGHFGPDALPGDARYAHHASNPAPFWCAFVARLTWLVAFAAGAAASRSRSSRRATPWSASRRRPTRSSCTSAVERATKKGQRKPRRRRGKRNRREPERSGACAARRRLGRGRGEAEGVRGGSKGEGVMGRRGSAWVGGRGRVRNVPTCTWDP